MGEHPDAEFGLVMPFVTVTSKGGPHDDQSYVAGYEMGRLDAALEDGGVEFERYFHPANLPQIDLLAMHHGWVIAEQEAWEEHPDEWVRVVLRPSPNGGYERGVQS